MTFEVFHFRENLRGSVVLTPCFRFPLPACLTLALPGQD